MTRLTTVRYSIVSYMLPHLHTPWSRVLLEKLPGSKLAKKSPAFYGTRRFITAFTSAARHLSLSQARSFQSMPPYPTSCISILVIYSHLRLGLPCGLFPSVFPIETLYTPLLPAYMLYAPPISFFSILSHEIYVVRGTDPFLMVHNMIHFYGEELLAPRPAPKLEDHSSSAVRDCLCNKFAAVLRIGGRSSILNLSTSHAMVKGTLLSWC